MKTKRVLRYYCDFCKKAGCSKFHMERHEKHCTMNPDRNCRMCDANNGNSTDLAKMIALLPNPKDFERTERIEVGWFGDGECIETKAYTGLEQAVAAILPELWDMADGCPACMLAALRQGGLTSHIGSDTFDYKKEVASFWADRRETVADYEP